MEKRIVSEVNIFDYLKSINEKSDYLDVDGPNYNQRILNTGLSFFPDTIFYANEANGLVLSNQMHYDFLYFLVEKRKRYSKWFKKEEDNQETLNMISEYYDININMAKEYLRVLKDEDISEIKRLLTKGGVKK